MTKIKRFNSTLSADPSKQMKRGAIERTKAMPRENRKRKQKRAVEGLVYGPYHRWISGLSCHVAGRGLHSCEGMVKGHHLKRVGNGGQDYANEVPLCVKAHSMAHTSGDSVLEATYGVDLKSEALRYATMWDEREGT